MRKNTWSVVIFCALVGACVPTTFRWYQPTGEGVLKRPGCGVPEDVMNFTLDDAGSYLSVSVRLPNYRGDQSHGDKSLVSYSILLSKNTSFKIADPIFVFLSMDGNELFRYEFKGITVLGSSESPTWAEVPANSELKSQERAPTLKYYGEPVVGHYNISALVKSLPDRFRIRYPDYLVNKKPHEGAIVTYEKFEGIFLARRCFF